MEMLTNYEYTIDYTIDYTNDADGAAETWGIEAGYGIISAAQMLAWVETNCGAACPGETAGCFANNGSIVSGSDQPLVNLRNVLCTKDGPVVPLLPRRTKTI